MRLKPIYSTQLYTKPLFTPVAFAAEIEMNTFKEKQKAAKATLAAVIAMLIMATIGMAAQFLENLKSVRD